MENEQTFGDKIESIVPFYSLDRWVMQQTTINRTSTQESAKFTIHFRFTPNREQLHAICKVLKDDVGNPCKGGKFSIGTVRVWECNGNVVTFLAQRDYLCD